MSRDPYRSSSGDIPFSARGSQRWDTERFAMERDRARFEERESRISRGPGGRVRERSVDEIYERRGPRGYEDDRYESRRHYEEEPSPRFPPPGRDRVVIEKERVRERDYSPSPPRRAPARPGLLRRQSSLDTFDRRPLTRYVEREEYGPPARYREELPRPVPLTPIPLPRTRALPPPRRYEREREYDEIEIAEPDFYGDEHYRGYPERVREREIIRKKRRSRSRDSRHGRSVKSSVRSSSTSSSGSSTTAISVRSEFPKKGKTRMPARLVSKQAIIDLGYPFEEDGEVIIIQKALGRENIDEVIKLSEDYKSNEKSETVIEERTEVYTIPAPLEPHIHHAPEPHHHHENSVEIVKETRTVEFSELPHHHHHHDAVIINAGPGPEYSDPIPIGPLALALPDRSRAKDERAIRAEIKALEAEKEALRAEKRADRELRKAERIRREGAGEVVLYERERSSSRGEEVTIIRKERVEEDGGVRIEKDRKGRMSISVPKYYR